MKRYLFGQSLGANHWTWGGVDYSKVLVEDPVITNLETWNTAQPDLDFKESAAFTDTSPTKQLTDSFILVWPNELSRIIVGAELTLMCTLRADGSHTTYLDELVARLLQVDMDGSTELITTFDYTFDTPPSFTANKWSDLVGAKIYKNLDYYELERFTTLLLEVDVYAHTVTDATNQKVRLHHGRGSSELVLAFVEVPR